MEENRIRCLPSSNFGAFISTCLALRIGWASNESTRYETMEPFLGRSKKRFPYIFQFRPTNFEIAH